MVMDWWLVSPIRIMVDLSLVYSFGGRPDLPRHKGVIPCTVSEPITMETLKAALYARSDAALDRMVCIFDAADAECDFEGMAGAIDTAIKVLAQDGSLRYRPFFVRIQTLFQRLEDMKVRKW